jgi:hypothetical protein
MTKSLYLIAFLLCAVTLIGARTIPPQVARSSRPARIDLYQIISTTTPTNPGPGAVPKPPTEPSTLLSFSAALVVGGSVILLGRLRKGHR